MLRFYLNLTVALFLSAIPCMSVQAATKPWTSLTPMQQEALAPIAQEWDTLPDKQQKRLLATTKRYHKLSAEKIKF